MNKKINKYIILTILIFIVSIITTLAAQKNVIKNYQSTNIYLKVSGEKNPLSKGNEISIIDILVNGKTINLLEKENKDLFIYDSNTSTLNLKDTNTKGEFLLEFSKAKEIEIIFNSNKNSGVLEIKDGDSISYIDLYSDNISSRYVYKVKSNISNDINWGKTLFISIFLSLVYIITIILPKENDKKILYFYMLFSLLLFILARPIHIVNQNILIFSILLGISYLIGRISYSAYHNLIIKKYKSKLGIVLIILASLYGAFALAGNELFVNTDKKYIPNIMCYILLTLWMLPVISIVLYKMEMYSDKVLVNYKTNNIKLFKVKIFSISFITGILYMIAYNPANMFTDTYFQYLQIYKIHPYSDAHAFFHTLFLKFMLFIVNTPSIIVLAQILLISLITSIWMSLLYVKGINKKLLYFVCIFYSINIANGTQITNIWKDTIFTICLLLLTFLIYRVIENKEFFEHNINNFVLILCLIGTMLFRHNGIIAGIGSMIFFVIFTYIHKKTLLNKVSFSIALTLFCIAFIKGPIYEYFDVIPNQKGFLYTAPVHGIANIIYNDKDEDLAPKTKDIMFNVLEKEEWKNSYDPYNADYYLFGYEKYLPNLSIYETSEIIKSYITSFFRHPWLIIEDRLTGTDLIWNIIQPKEAFNFIIGSQLDNSDKEIDIRLQEGFGVNRKENILTRSFNTLFDYVQDNVLLNILILRPGIWLLYMMIISIKFVVNKSKYIYTLIPVIGNIISLFLSMTHQSFRYVWFINLIAIFIILIGLTKENISEK